MCPRATAISGGDDFEEPFIDTDKWVVASLRDPVSGDLVPGAAGNHILNNKYAGYVTPEDSFTEDGSLVLLNQKRSYRGTSPAGNYSYTSGWIMSMHRGYFNKGYVEARAKFPSGDKVWPAIWLIAEDLKWGPEWDLWEYFGYRGDVGYDNMGMHLMTGNWQSPNWDADWLASYDALVVATDHEAFPWRRIAEEGRILVDARGAVPREHVRGLLLPLSGPPLRGPQCRERIGS